MFDVQVVHHLRKLDMFRAMLMLNEVNAVLCVRRARPISFPRFREFKWSLIHHLREMDMFPALLMLEGARKPAWRTWSGKKGALAYTRAQFLATRKKARKRNTWENCTVVQARAQKWKDGSVREPS